jgi:hypothetical protein
MRKLTIARVGDWLAFGLLGLAFIVDVTGGFRVGRGWYRLSVRDPAHLLVVALSVALLRHLAVRHPSLRERLIARRLARPGSAAHRLRRDRLRPREWLAAAALMVGATLVLLWPQVVQVGGVPDHGDPLFSMWRLAWVAHQIAAHPAHLFDANIFYPAPDTLAYSDATLLPGLLAAPLLWLGAPLAAVHGILFLASFVLAGLAMFLLVRALTGRFLPAALAGVLFAFYPYRFSTYSHLEMQGVFLMPLTLLFLLRTLESGRLRDGLALGTGLVLQTLWSLYLGAYLAVGLAVITVARWLGGHFDWRARVRALGVAAVVTLALIGPYSWPYWVARHTVGERPRGEVEGYSAAPVDFLSVNENNALYGPYLHRDVTAERQLFPGATALVLAVVALAPPATPMAAAAGLGLLAASDAALGLHGALFRWLYDLAPPFRAFRVPARFGMLMGLCLALLAGLGLARLLDWWRPWRGAPIVAAVLIAGALFELRPALRLTAPPPEAPSIYAALPADPQTVVVDLPLPRDDSEYWIDPTYMYYSTFRWHRLLNGYSGFTPAWYPRLVVASRELPSDNALEVLRQAGAQYLVVHAEFYEADDYARLVAAFDARRDLQLVATQPSAGGECRLYRVLTAPHAASDPSTPRR